VLLLLAAAGCAAGHDPPMMSREQLGKLVGLTEPQLIRQVGVPTRSYMLDNSKFLEYDRTRLIYSYGEPLGGPLGTYQPNAGLEAPYSGVNPFYQPEPAVHVCDVLFEIADGRVQSFRQRGNSCG
jgi:hypothetical protein